MSQVQRKSSQTRENGANDSDEEQIVSSIQSVPITELRRPYISKPPNATLEHSGTARANVAPSVESPQGTTRDGWTKKHSHQTVLQQHCDFFDIDKDGVIWPRDTFTGFYRLGYGAILSLVAMVIIHANFSYPTLSSWIPDPFFRLYLGKIHKDKHGSDSNTYDHEGRFVPQKFEDIFTKYADGRDHLTIWDVLKLMKGQRCIADPIGWGGALFEWLATYILLWPEDGMMKKEDIRGVYDGSIFYTIAARRVKKVCEVRS
ncbi:Caleosin related protein-domain-containing protein [Lophiotrema nucula]|uniref:Caleosin related protein-domain-containing protein n=1 Tax=Lophiotrema nucula TaxID=690887 RepID=A0A6A5Z105_9PLEO|nr:Caleosin related protein-domain-containing protein [Lophiotrema nucula]